MSIKMVADIVELFNDEGVIDMATYFGNGVTEMFANMDTVWFLQQDETRPDCYTLSGTVATISADAGTVVVSPITGEVETITDNGDGTKTIILTKYGKSDPDDPNSETVPVMKIVLGNVTGSSCIVGQKVTAGSTRLGTVSASGKITYEHLEGSGSPINPKDELDKMIAIINLEFAPALPSEYNSISSWFGPRKPPTSGASSWHKGIDLGAPTGTPIYAIADGVASSHYQQGGYGNYVVVDHGNGFISEYGHMSKIIVRSGDVKKGDVIGLVGSTGASTGPHLHLTIKNSSMNRDLDGDGNKDKQINPLEEAGLNIFYGETKSNY
ncbi:MAG: M23 family metallopeptidase [Clostridiales bacterium]|nr:M23 family metallopeptidase [Clostridiales bacterium]